MKRWGGLVLVLIFLLFVLMDIMSSSANVPEDSSGSYDFVLPYEGSDWSSEWHTGKICIPCHNSLLERTRSLRIMNDCACHIRESGKSGYTRWHTQIDILDVKKIHNNSPCIRCHFGKATVIGEEEIHRIHAGRSCEVCHIDENKLVRPNTTDCNVCHPYGPHVIHKDLNNLCALCHGKYGWDTVNRFENTGEMPPNISINLKEDRRTFPTIADVLTSIFNSIIK